MPKIDANFCQQAAKPAAGNVIHYDAGHKNAVPGFGLRITPAGAKAFILNYRTRAGRERRYTIGSYPTWTAAAAREKAAELKRQIADGGDPLADIESERGAPTIQHLCDRYREEWLPRKRPRSRVEDERAIAQQILPAWRHRKVTEITHTDVDALHRAVTKAGHATRANRIAALISKLFALSIRWGWRADNPAKGLQRNAEQKRHRYLSGKELAALTAALAEFEDKQAANIFRLLLLTGARSGEVRAMRWGDLDLEAGAWVKPGSTTKQRTMHRVPLSAPARQLLAGLRAEAEEGAEFVFPGRYGGHRDNVKDAWAVLCKAAGLRDVRVHDLRHSYASILASAGLSLPVIGALLGHSNPATTQRYAHLMDDPLRAATERVGAIVAGGPAAETVAIKPRRSR